MRKFTAPILLTLLITVFISGSLILSVPSTGHTQSLGDFFKGIKKALEEGSEEKEEKKPTPKDGEQEKEEDPVGDFFKGVKKALGEGLEDSDAKTPEAKDEDSEEDKLTGDLLEELKKAFGKGPEKSKKDTKKSAEKGLEALDDKKPGPRDGEQGKEEDPVGDFFKGIKKALGEGLEDSDKKTPEAKDEDSEEEKLTGDLLEELKKAFGKGPEKSKKDTKKSVDNERKEKERRAAERQKKEQERLAEERRKRKKYTSSINPTPGKPVEQKKKAAPSSALPTRAQSKLTPRAFLDTFKKAYQAGDKRKIDVLVRGNKILAHRFIEEFLRLFFLRKGKNAQDYLKAAGAMAKSYNRIFNDSSLSTRVELYRSRGPEEKKGKHKADRKLLKGKISPPSTLPVHTQSKLTSRAFLDTFIKASRTGNQRKIDALVYNNKNLARRFANDGLRLFLSSKGENAQAYLKAAGALAESYKRAFKDNFLSFRVNLYRSWGPEEKKKKREADRKSGEGTKQYRKGDARGALLNLLEALELYRKIRDQHFEHGSLVNLGTAYSALGDSRRAISYLTKSLQIARSLGVKKDESLSLDSLGIVCDRLGDHRRAISYYTQALQIARETGDRKSEGRVLGNMGSAYSSLGDPRRAFSYYTKAHKISREMGDKKQEGFQLGNLGNAYVDLGNFIQGVSYYTKSLQIARSLGDREDRHLINLGRVYSILGNYRRAMSYLTQALKIARKKNYKREEGQSLYALGGLYVSIGDYRRSRFYFTEVLIVAREIEDMQMEQAALGSLGYLHYTLGAARRAISYIKQSLQIARKLGNKGEESRALGNLGFVHLDVGKIQEAARLMKYSGPLRRSILKIAQGRFSDAVSILAGRLERDEKLIAVESLFGSYVTLARAHEGLGEKEDAIRFYQKAADLTEIQREGLLDDQREHFFGAKPSYNYTRLTPYEGLIRISTPQLAFESSEAIKARRMIERAAKREAGRDVMAPSGLQVKESEAALKITNLKKRKDSATKRNDKKELARIETSLKAARKKRKNLIDRLYREAPEYAAIRYPRPLKLEEIALRWGEVLIEFALTETTLHAFFLRGKKIVKATRKEVGRAEISRLVEAYRRQLSDPEKVSKPDFDHASGYRLYSLLLKDLLPLVHKEETVIIVPGGKLALLPFEALPISPQKPVMKKSRKGYYYPSGVKWVGDVHTLRYEQSASAFTQRRNLRKKNAKEGLFTLADPVFGRGDSRSGKALASKKGGELSLMRAVEEQGGLKLVRLPETGKLARALGRLFKKSDSLIGSLATKKSLFRKDLRGYRHLVFATHGLLGGKVSGLMEPALALSREPGSRERDAFLTLSEAMRLRLKADVVALTACETGLGKDVAGEGVMGMGRAFQYAGARSVLVSLWSVAESSTTRLVERFFAHLKKGTDKVQSLRLARKEIRNAGFRHPFFWAPFILIGE